jgi:hypothetical protein
LGLYKCIQELRWEHSVGPKSNGWCPYEKGENAKKHRDKGHMPAEAETGVLWPQAKWHLEPLGLQEARSRPFLWTP